jgi:predicted ATP-dependent protease
MQTQRFERTRPQLKLVSILETSNMFVFGLRSVNCEMAGSELARAPLEFHHYLHHQPRLQSSELQSKYFIKTDAQRNRDENATLCIVAFCCRLQIFSDHPSTNRNYVGRLVEFYKSLSLYYTKMSFKIRQFFRRVFLTSNLL